MIILIIKIIKALTIRNKVLSDMLSLLLLRKIYESFMTQEAVIYVARNNIEFDVIKDRANSLIRLLGDLRLRRAFENVFLHLRNLEADMQFTAIKNLVY